MKHLISVLVVTAALAFLILNYIGWIFLSDACKLAFILFLYILYIQRVERKNTFVNLFFITSVVGELVYFFTWYLENYGWDIFYFITNGLYILSYIFLILSIAVKFHYPSLFKTYSIQIIILLFMDIASVALISSAAEYELDQNEFVLEVIYNAVVMILLTFSFLNYIVMQNRKGMILLIGSIFIVFSEMLQYAYNYVAYYFQLINMLSLALFVAALIFFYYHTKLPDEKNTETFLETDY